MSNETRHTLTLVALLAWVYFAFPILHYGSIWASKHDPIRNVTVTFSGGSRLTGDLANRFDGLLELRQTDRVTVFSPGSLQEMSSPMDEASIAQRTASLGVQWRLALAMLVYLLPPIAIGGKLMLSHLENKE